MNNEMSINLLRTQSTLTQEEVLLLAKLRVAAIVVTAIVLCIGVFVGVSFMAAKFRLDSLTAQQTEANRQLVLNSKKEVLLLSLKSRLPLINKGVALQYPWQSILATVSQIVVPPNLHTLSIDENNVLSLDVSANSLEEIQDMINKTSTLSQSNNLKSPHIQSLQSQTGGKLDATIQFTPSL